MKFLQKAWYKALAALLVLYTLVYGLLIELPADVGILDETIRNLYFHVQMWFGMLLMLLGSRLDDPQAGPTPLRWLVGLLAIALAGAMVVAVPVSIGSENATAQQVAQADAAIAMQSMQLQREKQQLADPKAVDQVIAQAEKAGQIPPGVSEEQKQAQARQFIDTQLKPQLEKQEQQLGQAKLGRDLAVQQRRFGGTGRSAVLAIAFVVLALVALL